MNKLRFPCLVRDYIHESLYSLGTGYFMKDSHQLGSLSSPLRYNNLDGVYSYYQILGKNYPNFAFLTPVEIFQPWYGHSIANYCLEKLKEPYIKIIEIGGGTGTCALSILDYYKFNNIQMYNTIQYTICEISPVLSKIASDRIQKAHPVLWNNKNIKILNKSGLDWNTKILGQAFIIGLEVLDNLPHDRIWKSNNQWNLQTKVTQDLQEIKENIDDSLISKSLTSYLNMPPKTNSEIELEHSQGLLYNILKYFNTVKNPDNMFLPTIAYKLIENFCSHIKSPYFILADFDSLPKKKISGLYAPIVSRKGKLAHEADYYESYLCEFGNVDIFFPVDFRLLQQFYRDIKGKSGLAMKSYQFMDSYAKNNWTQVKTGYRPLFDDFRNTSFFLSE
jgi:SAM-dependent MidA family methyltransferase